MVTWAVMVAAMVGMAEVMQVEATEEEVRVAAVMWAGVAEAVGEAGREEKRVGEMGEPGEAERAAAMGAAAMETVEAAREAGVAVADWVGPQVWARRAN